MQSIMLALAFAGAAQPYLPTASSDDESAQAPVASQAAGDVGQDRDETPATDPYPREAIGEGQVVGRLASTRWTEDWRAMADQTKRDDFLDRLKFLPLSDDGEVYLTLSGEIRVRSDFLTNTGLVERPTERRDRLRVIGGADLHLGPNVRLFAEIAHGGLDGRNLTTQQTNFKNDLVVQQAFAEVSGDIAGLEAGARYGRQEFLDGSALLIGSRDFNTIRFVVNGLRTWVRGSRVRAGLFDFEFTELGAGGTSDDRSDDDTRFSGVNLGFVLPTDMFGGSKLYFDPFIWRLRQNDLTWGPQIADDRRLYTGARLWGSAGPITVDWNANYQSGSFGDRDISAWQVFLSQTYRLGEDRTAPSVGLRFDYGSGGNGTSGTGTLRTATTPYGINAPFGYQITMTPTNLLAVTPGFNFQAFKNFSVNLEYQLSYRPEETDAVYRPINRPYVGTDQVSGHKVADMIRMQTRWNITPRLFMGTRTEYTIARNVLTRAGYADSFFATAWLSYRF